MRPPSDLALAHAVLGVHVAVIAFNVLGLIVIPLGARLGWAFVRVRWLRFLHVASWAAVAVQALAGRECFLTIWQDALTGTEASTPLIVRWVERIIYWPLPLWVFAALYVAAFAYVVALLFLVPLDGHRAGIAQQGRMG
jgi:hypothetical protein